MPSRKPEPWRDIYAALWWGNSAPQSMDNRYANKFTSFRDHWNYDDVSEDCLRINVFTPALQDGRRRPGLVLDPRRRLHERQRHRAGRLPPHEMLDSVDSACSVLSERVHLLGGTVQVASAPGRGTTLTIDVAL